MAKTRRVLGLDWPEPLVTFALSCGSWSSHVLGEGLHCISSREATGNNKEELFASIDWHFFCWIGCRFLNCWFGIY
ncbi:uncharacterized protein M6B38_128495 [Iris pallida]|uniref:Secreted protein n=1 Tax=Iris pallida TaxID=29817 RepID=A0AAX6G5J8_IRIPA|nr:uncharacterized protein M6B38_128495 [Iris pallida]